MNDLFDRYFYEASRIVGDVVGQLAWEIWFKLVYALIYRFNYG